MRRKCNPTPFYVINESLNSKTFDKYNVMDYLIDEYDNKYKGKSKNKRPSTFKEMVEFVNDVSMYQFWSRCEYEIMLGHWPPRENDKLEKIDIYWQIKMNIETITRILIENLGLDIKENH